MDRRNAVIWGAGRIGRGFLAEVLIDAGFHVVFVDKNQSLVERLRAAGSYGIFKNDGKNQRTVTINDFEIFHTSEREKIGRYFASPDALAGVAVMAGDLGDVMADIAGYLPEKIESNPAGTLDIVFCVNMLSPANAGKEALCREAYKISDEAGKYSSEKVGFVDTVVFRVAPGPTPEILALDPLGEFNDGYGRMPMDALGFVGKPPQGQMVMLTDNIHAEEARKIFSINMAHALMCYLGSPLGITNAAEAVFDERLRETVYRAVDEAVAGIWKEFGFTDDMEEWKRTVASFLENAALCDSLPRLGADVPRKAGIKDRLVGPALLSLKHGGVPRAISKGIAAAYRYTGQGSKSEDIIQFINTNGISEAIHKFSGLEPSHPLHKLILDEYNA